MDLIKSYTLVENKDGYDLILYLDTETMYVEFADELGRLDKQSTKLKQSIIQQISEKFPNIKINAVKIMVGTMMLASFFMGMPVSAQASETASGGATQTRSAYNYNVSVSINGNTRTFQNKPMIYNDISYVPLSEFGKAIGAQVWWNSTSNTVGINKNGVSIAFKRDSKVARVNGVQKSMPASLVIGGTTYAPLKFIAQSLGYSVSMNTSTRTVNVTSPASQTKYTVLAGDSLWKISQKFGVSVGKLKQTNNLISDTIFAGQTLIIPKAPVSPAPAPAPAPRSNTQWPDTTYIVQPGDTATSISKKFGIPAQDILKYNYMSVNDWFEAGDKIAISGYAPRVYTVTRGQASAPAQRGAPVDWVLEGQYLVKRNAVFTLVDVDTGKQFKVKMIGGYNHIDIEPLTSADTAAMKSLFGTWTWSPRAMVIYIDGMNLAASLSGMPHDVDTITDNGVTGHFDLYMKNSSPHSKTASTAYNQEHANMAAKAAGQ